MAMQPIRVLTVLSLLLLGPSLALPFGFNREQAKSAKSLDLPEEERSTITTEAIGDKVLEHLKAIEQDAAAYHDDVQDILNLFKNASEGGALSFKGGPVPEQGRPALMLLTLHKNITQEMGDKMGGRLKLVADDLSNSGMTSAAANFSKGTNEAMGDWSQMLETFTSARDVLKAKQWAGMKETYELLNSSWDMALLHQDKWNQAFEALNVALTTENAERASPGKIYDFAYNLENTTLTEYGTVLVAFSATTHATAEQMGVDIEKGGVPNPKRRIVLAILSRFAAVILVVAGTALGLMYGPLLHKWIFGEKEYVAYRGQIRDPKERNRAELIEKCDASKPSEQPKPKASEKVGNDVEKGIRNM